MRKQILLISVTLSFYTIYAQKNNQTPVQPNRKLTHNNPQPNKDNQQKDTVPVVKAMDKISNNATIKLPLVYSIPAEAFRPSSQNGNNGYYKIRRDGLGTLAGSGETINNSLVAPLNLPNGAVITKVEFNMLSIYPQGYMPHLRLMQKGLVKDDRQEGAYLGVVRINKYSVNSFGLTGKGGLLDVKTLTSGPMNFRINNQANSYYFEILANKTDWPPPNAAQSFWPNDNYLFIWSVEVHYFIP